MFAAGFFKPQGDWCAANHLEYQVHLNHEEMEMELTHSEGSFFRDMRDVKVPGIDAIWHQIWKDTIRISRGWRAPHRTFMENLGHSPRASQHTVPRQMLTMARYIVNEQFVRGVNLVEMMYFPATSSGPKPPPSYMGRAGLFRSDTYVRRMSYLMAMGRPDARWHSFCHRVRCGWAMMQRCAVCFNGAAAERASDRFRYRQRRCAGARSQSQAWRLRDA